MATRQKLISTLILLAAATLGSVPLSAQPQPFICRTAEVPVIPVIRAEGHAELVGDLVVSCSGGVPTVAGGDCAYGEHERIPIRINHQPAHCKSL